MRGSSVMLGLATGAAASLSAPSFAAWSGASDQVAKKGLWASTAAQGRPSIHTGVTTPSQASSGEHPQPASKTLQAALVATGAGLAAQAARKRDRKHATRIMRHACKIVGDWADGSVSDGKVSMYSAEVEGGIIQYRMVHPPDSQRYGEEFDQQVGSTDNAYLLKPENDPWVMLGAFTEDGRDLFFKEVESEVLERVGHLILQFWDGEQASFVEEFINRRPPGSEDLLVHASMPIIIALRKALPEEVMSKCKLVPIKNKTVLEIEKGRVMKFVLCPTLKLPEAFAAFDPVTGSLFTGKFFSAHRAIDEQMSPQDGRGQAGWEQFAADWYHLFDCYFFTKTAQNAVRKIFMLAEEITGPDVQQLMPLHGPVAREQCWKLMAKYEAWTEQKLRKDTRRNFEVLVMYASAYGHTKSLAASISKGLSTSGVRVVDLNLEHKSAEEVKKALETADGFCIGSPTLGGEMPSQVKEALGVVLTAKADNKVPCGVFGSYGWSGEAVDELQFRLKDSGFPLCFDPIRAKFRPTEEVLKKCEASGVRMSQKLSSNVLQRMKSKARNVAEVKKKSIGGSAIDAFNKMKTSQCVMSSKDAEGQDVFTAVSWLNQASFDPPGLTIAVPKEESHDDMLIDTKLEELLQKYNDKVCTQPENLSTEEARSLLVELFDFKEDNDETEAVIDKALEAVDPNQDGTVTFDEARGAIGTGGELRPEIRKAWTAQGKLDEAHGDETSKKEFTLSMVPSNTDAFELAAAAEPHKKAKASNGCTVLAASHAFVECEVSNVLNAGDHTVYYCHVKSGKVFDEKEKTAMADVGSVLAAAMKVDADKEKAPAPAMAAGGLAQVPSTPSMASAFAGVSTPGARQSDRNTARTALSARGGARGGEESVSRVETWTGLTPGKEYRLQTQSETVGQDTRTIRSLDWDRDRFDIEFALERGTTYNSYIIKGAEKTALVDTSHEKFDALFFDALDKEVDLAKLDYLIVSHTEPDHSGLVGKVLEKAKEAGNEELTVVGSKVCIAYLENLIFTPFKSQIVNNNYKIDLGGGHELEFVIAPNLHWPDTMFTFDHATKILYTCDAFGMHYCSDNLVDVEGTKELLPHYSLYYDCLMKPNARSVLTALKKISGFEVKNVATGHGPMLTENTSEWMEMYRSWSGKATEKLGPSVAIFWVGNFAQSERLSQLFAHGLTSSNVNVEMHDLNAIDAFEITECLARSEVVAVMSPPINSTASANFASIVANCKPKKHQFMILDSYGGQEQESVALLRSEMMRASIPEAMPAMEIKGEVGMTAQTMQGFEENGMFLARKLTQKDKAAAAKNQNKDLVKALGRLASSLYVATAKKAGVRHAMVASWVTPASMEPLGLSLTIAKDRAMEPLLRIGDSFTLNILEDGKPVTLKLMKHFLQKFAPGADRLDGVDCFEGNNGAAVLRGACAYLECKIIARMDASDHWVGYAEVVGGDVAVADAIAATHHRKIGTYY